MLIGALFLIIKNWKQPRYPYIDDLEWIIKLGLVFHKMKYYPLIMEQATWFIQKHG